MYHFVRCKNSVGVEGWFLVLTPLTPLPMIEHIAKSMIMRSRFARDPHFQDSSSPDRAFINALVHPDVLYIRWIETFTSLVMSHGTVHMNPSGGMVGHEHHVVLESLDRETLMFPGWEPKNSSQEVFTVSQWPTGTHWYISSSHRTDCIGPFKTSQAAEYECKVLNPAASVNVNTSSYFPRQGD